MDSSTADVAFEAYSCLCPRGFVNGTCAWNFRWQLQDVCNLAGGNCDVDVDECELYADRCENSASCVESSIDDRIAGGDWSCSCIAGYSGGMCDWDVSVGGGVFDDECTIADAGTCDTDVDECASNPCQADATCVDLSNCGRRRLIESGGEVGGGGGGGGGGPPPPPEDNCEPIIDAYSCECTAGEFLAQWCPLSACRFQQPGCKS